jgi:hypothetical protein
MKIKDIIRRKDLNKAIEEDIPKTFPADLRKHWTIAILKFSSRWIENELILNKDLRDPTNPDEVKKEEVEQVVHNLLINIVNAEDIYAEIRSRVMNDPKHLSLNFKDGLDNKHKRIFERRYKGIFKTTPKNVRELMVLSIVWSFVEISQVLKPAPDTTAERINKLHYLIDRRIRIAERMLYDVGVIDASERKWKKTEIKSKPAGPWKDGYKRIFEYPRISRDKMWDALCKPKSDGSCSATSMGESPHPDAHSAWRTGRKYLRTRINVNFDASGVWDRPPEEGDRAGDYIIWFKKSPIMNPPGDPFDAIKKLFTPSEDFKERNHFMCDHVIHILHLEAMVFAAEKRGLLFEQTKKNALEKEGYLRIDMSWRRKSPRDDTTDISFLGNPVHLLNFEHVEINRRDLLVGDHLIIYNHQAYRSATSEGVWALENAVVVQTIGTKPKNPKKPESDDTDDENLLLQGHGINPLTVDQCLNKVRNLFAGEIKHLQKIVETSIDKADEAGKEPDSPIFFGQPDAALVRRFSADDSNFVRKCRKADWFLKWKPSSFEFVNVFSDPVKKQRVEEKNRIKYDKEGTAGWFGYFPLWLAKGDQINGKFRDCESVMLDTEIMDPWAAFSTEGSDKGVVEVIRPRL